jgi:hypothetical protein
MWSWAALTVTGACVSPDPDDNEEAHMWFNCVEEMVFTDDDFCSDVEPSAETSPPVNKLADWRKLQALQAAYVVCLYQNWEGVDASKRRIRRHRFSTVVSVSRHRMVDVSSNWTRSRGTSASKPQSILTTAPCRSTSSPGRILWSGSS